MLFKSKMSLANQVPRVHADVDLHDHIAEPAGVRLGLMRGIGRNHQPVAGFNLEGLAPDDRLPAVFAGYGTPLAVDEILPVGDLAANNHLSGTAGENVKVIYAGVLLRVVPDAIDLGQTQDRLLAVHPV